jgi:hypothetical protein
MYQTYHYILETKIYHFSTNILQFKQIIIFKPIDSRFDVRDPYVGMTWLVSPGVSTEPPTYGSHMSERLSSGLKMTTCSNCNFFYKNIDFSFQNVKWYELVLVHWHIKV